MKSFILKSVLFLVIATFLTNCTNSDKFESISPELKTYSLTTNKTVSSLVLTATATPTIYLSDDVIEAYVNSNDATGNFYKSISCQDILSTSGTPVGFSLSIDKSALFGNGFTSGRKIYIKLKGLAIAKVFGTTQIGLIDPTDATKITGISELEYQNFVFPSSTIVDENSLVRHVSLTNAALDINQNTLLEIDNVQFADNSLARTYFDIDSGGFATNHDIVDVTGGTTRYCRVSQYCQFSANSVPSGRGSIRGIMSKYNTDYQFTVRNEGDFKLNNPRIYLFNGTLTENFTSFAVNQLAFANYLDFSTEGTKKWKIVSGALEMSAYSGNVEKNKAYFLVPVDMTVASTIKFDLKVGFFANSLGLKVYRTTNFVPGMKIKDATLYDISTSFSVAFPTANATLTNLTYNIPATVTGNGYFVFEYTGTNISTGPPVTTTVDIDNIIVN